MSDSLQTMLFNEPRVNEAWLARFDAAWAQSGWSADKLSEQIQARYDADAGAKDGFSRLACVAMKRGDTAGALRLFERDAACGRQTWWQQLRHAECEARAGNLGAALERVRVVYEGNPDAVNGHAAIAWALRETGRAKEAADILRKDLFSRRIAPGFCLNAALMLAEEGLVAEASALVEAAYRGEASLHDGFAHIGKALQARGKDSEALAFFQRDAQANRISPTNRLAFVDLLTAAGQWDEAAREIPRLYADNPALRDRFARLGSLFRAKGETEKALTFYRLDAEASRLSPAHLVIFADLLGRAGCWDEAVSQVLAAYAADPALKNGFARLGVLRKVRGEPDAAFELYRRDAETNRLCGAHRIVYAELQARAGCWEEAEAGVRTAYGEDPALRDGFSRLAPWALPEADTGFFARLSRLDRDAGRQTDRGALLCAGIMRARASLAAELAASSEWIPPELDIRRQWLALEELSRRSQPPEAPVRILNAELYLAEAKDALIQFRELVLQEGYFFKCDRPDPLIVDGGANLGMAMAYFKWLYPQARIVAFEPHPEMYQLCSRSMAKNRWRNVALHPCALLDRDGAIVFNILGAMPMGSSVTRRLADARPDLAPREVTVPCACLSQYLVEPVDFLKLDIEGAETRVLRESAAHLELVRRGFIEYHYGADDNSMGELLSILERAGFRYRIADPAAATAQMPVYGRRMDPSKPWSCNIYFQRGSI